MALQAESRIVTTETKLLPLARVLSEELFLTQGLRLPVLQTVGRDGDVVLELDANLRGDAYRLIVADRATVTGAGYSAAAIGSVTLLQAVGAKDGRVSLPRMTIQDQPHFAYCGAMLDVARKPFAIDTLRQCVQVCRFYKIRYLHLHMTDENAWTFPSTAFPQLGSQNFAWAGGRKPEVYGLAELKALVAFADARSVIIVPELEMPGHSGQLRGSLPEIFGYKDAAGKAAPVGVINMVREPAYAALDTLIGEVCDVFQSSPFVHIGCDEASLGGIEATPEVKAFMEKHRLSSTGAVFNHFVNRMHAIVKKHGKRMIVWEGAPLDPVAPPRDVIFMPWVGGAGTAADLIKRGYAVINAPWGAKTPYIDPYLVNGAQLRRGEPLLLGATSLLWERPQENAVPFLRETGALRNEPTYNPNSGRHYPDFLRRLQSTDARLDRLLCGFTFAAQGVLDSRVYLRTEAIFTKSVTATLASSLEQEHLRYTLDGSQPTRRSRRYTGPIEIARTATLKAQWFGEGGDTSGRIFSREFQRAPVLAHDAVGAAVTLSPQNPGYFGPGAKGLTDGLLSVGDEAGSPGWVGWEGQTTQIQIDVDLGRAKRIRSVGAHFLRAAGGIALPRTVDFSVSTHGKAYHSVAHVSAEFGSAHRGWYRADVDSITARYLRVRPIPAGDWTFVDEVGINFQEPGPTLRHAARGKPVTLKDPPSSAYAASGVQGLVDGFVARSPDFVNPQWLGVEGKNIDATVDLGSPIAIHKVGANFLQHVQAGIRIPQVLDVLVSDDGETFRKAASVNHVQNENPAFIETLTTDLGGVKARFVRVVAHTNGQWLFVDELFVNPEER
jgi:hexosaminidase